MVLCLVACQHACPPCSLRAIYSVPKATKVQRSEVTLAESGLDSSVIHAGRWLDMDSTWTRLWHVSDASPAHACAR